MRIIDRLDKYMTYSGINDNQITVNCGLSKGLLGKARSGDHDIGKKAVEKILNFYQDINHIWLLTGEGDMLRTSAESSAVVNSCSSELSLHDRLLRIIESQQRTIESQQRIIEKHLG